MSENGCLSREKMVILTIERVIILFIKRFLYTGPKIEITKGDRSIWKKKIFT